MSSVCMLIYTLYNGSKLNVMTTYFLKEAIEFQRIISIVIIDNRHTIPFNPMFL